MKCVRRGGRVRKNPVLLSILILVAALSGCKSGSLGPTRRYTRIVFTHGGAVTGIVHFTGKPPAPALIDMAQDPVCARAKGNKAGDPVRVSDGNLAGVLVYIQSGLGDRRYPITRTPVIIDQKNCRFHPRVAAAMAGQQVEFTNSDPIRHNVHMAPAAPGNNAFDISQGPHAGAISRYFHSPELMISIRCNNHPWMHAYLSVLANPFFAVTGPDGRFTLRGLPPGTYTVTAVHPTLGSRSATVTVAAQGTARQSFTY